MRVGLGYCSDGVAEMSTTHLRAESAARQIEDVFARGSPGGQIDGIFISPVEMRRNAIISVLKTHAADLIARAQSAEQDWANREADTTRLTVQLEDAERELGELRGSDGLSPFPWSSTKYVHGTSVVNPSTMLLDASGGCIGIVMVLNATTNLLPDIDRALSSSSGPAKLRRHMQIARKEAEEHYAASEAASAMSADLLAALKCFVDDERFQVGVGGNPNAVEKMIAYAMAAIAKAEGRMP